MIVMYGDNHTLIIAIIEKELGTLREGRTLMYEGFNQLTKDIVIMYGKDKADVVALITAAGIPFSEELQSKYQRDERTDTPRKSS